MTKFKLRRELPKVIEKYKTLSAADLHRFILQDYNKDIKPNTITTYFKRHAKLKADYEAVFSSAANSQIEVSGDLFMNGNFQESPSIKKWVIEKKPLVSKTYLESNVNALKRICQGIYYTREDNKLIEHQIESWIPKSPERISLEQFQEYLGHLQDSGNWTNGARLAFRDFWLSRERKTLLPSEVSGMVTSAPVDGVEHKIGRWKNVHVHKEKIYMILGYVKERYFLGYAAAFTGYKTGSRHAAVLTQYLKSKVYFDDDGMPSIEVTDKGFHRAGRLSFPKMLTPDIYSVLEECWKTNNNAFADLDDALMIKLLKEAYRIYLKDDVNPDGTIKEYSALELALAHPFHTLRHWFGRNMLEATNYNYSLVAPLGNWSSEAMLHKIYAEMPSALLKKAGLAALPQI